MSQLLRGIVTKEAEPETDYYWKTGEGVAEGIRRIVGEQLNRAIWHFIKNPASFDARVHETRKSIKKIRSAMRLARGVLGRNYMAVNTELREVGRELSGLRDAAAIIEAFDELNGNYRTQLGDRSLISVRDGLVARKRKLSSSFQRQGTAREVLESLRKVAAGVKKWDLNEGSFQVLWNGFARTLRQNRKARDKAYSRPRPNRFHNWRRRAKDLRYQIALLQQVWPPVLEGYLDAAHDLERKLGDDHNLVVLRDTILTSPDDFGKREAIGALLKIIEHRQSELRSGAQIMAVRLYGEKPKPRRRRLELCWAIPKAAG